MRRPSLPRPVSEEERSRIVRLGDLFREFRMERALTQRVAAAEYGTAPQALRDLEKGRRDPQLTTILRWAKFYGYRVELRFVPLEEEM